MDALVALYPRLSAGGFVVIDDYWEMESCRAAVDAYRSTHGLEEPLVAVDHACVMWRRAS
jgi:predicted kinase